MSATLMVAFPAVIIETVYQWKQSDLSPEVPQVSTKQLVVRLDGKNVLISSDQVMFVESFGDVVKINVPNEIVSTRKSLLSMEKELPNFIRIHRSYLINPDFVESYTHETVFLKEHEFPVGRTYKKTFLNKMESLTESDFA